MVFKHIESRIEMYKILIVDDDDFVRKAVIDLIPWDEIGFDKILEAPDGELALEMAIENRPDIILTDIRMPFMDGLELLMNIREIMPDTKVLILSAHDEFDYAKKAMTLGVTDYIVKPIRKESLINILKKTASQITKEKKQKETQIKMKKQLRQSLPLLRQNFLNSLVRGKVEKEEIEKRLDYLSLKFPSDYYTVCVFETDKKDNLLSDESYEDHELVKMSILSIMEESTLGNAIAFTSFNENNILVFFDDSNGTRRKILHDTLNYIQEKIVSNLGETVTIGVGSRVKGLSNLQISYNQAKSMLEYKVAKGENNILDIQILGLMKSENYYPIHEIEKLIKSIKLNKDFVKEINNLFSDIENNISISSSNLKVLMNEIVSGINKILIQFGEDALFDIYAKIDHIDTIENAKLLLINYAKEISDKIHTKMISKKQLLIEKAKEYLKENFGDSTISLNQVAQSIYISPSYLSMLFKKETGKSFVDYLTRLRLEKAMEYLRFDNLKTYEIAEKTGYNDSHYFCVSFKKHTGFTPSEYRKNYEKNKNIN